MTDHEHYAGVLSELNPQHRALREVIPDVYKGFGELSRAALAAGAVESKVKELMAMTIGVVTGLRRVHRVSRPRCGPRGRHEAGGG